MTIDPSLMNADEREVLEDLLVAAHADAKQKVEATMAEEMQKATAGMQPAAGDEAAVLNRPAARAAPRSPAEAPPPAGTRRLGLPPTRRRDQRFRFARRGATRHTFPAPCRTTRSNT